ncbi:MAG: hypothetical protein A3K19_29950 [Lentisphaerae bacterium RIFOXYB12_FULL_65_16]|nr:MAG: hypothetical protein A3K18_33560 [Lentisphaerae bacterium RIFOXYA12_64_32]OGV86549.1 MAG: hypothetical protein A3K19_29950 [Lentisphaerae bacterium RIFOXYB12_FULL_65_16]
MVRGLDLADMDAVVELGPGSGALTRHIIQRLSSRTAFIAVEKNPRMAGSLRGRFPRVIVHQAAAEELPAILRSHGLRQVDCVISGLPWANLPGRVQEDILGGVLEVLQPGGHFVAFAYLSGLLMPSGRRFRQRLADSFASVSTSRVVWPNLPPAFVYRCRLNGCQHVEPALGHDAAARVTPACRQS